ncbi:cadherin-18-like [Sphaeramia orbicularis]|uniref:cadherin-18-like n=1 Tax=Sphaeramia orbicularis TaxID=375764 RepID=UPI0011808085|nr:cadherin-18-like [Sphaeramia orbicularis]
MSNMDRETRDRYAVVIQAKDMAGSVGGLSGSTTINITLTDVNDNPPKFPQKSYQLYVTELAPLGKAVGRIRATDEDQGQNAEMTYSITNAEAAAIFSISTDESHREGIISLKQPLTHKQRYHEAHLRTYSNKPQFTSINSSNAVSWQRKENIGFCLWVVHSEDTGVEIILAAANT